MEYYRLQVRWADGARWEWVQPTGKFDYLGQTQYAFTVLTHKGAKPKRSIIITREQVLASYGARMNPDDGVFEFTDTVTLDAMTWVTPRYTVTSSHQPKE